MNVPSATRKKSPRAPSMSLEEALERVQRVYDRDRLHPAPTDIVAQHLGYKGASNGAALSALASVRYFGLVERPRDGYLAVTKEFENFKFAPDEKQRRKLLLDFLRKPPLYSELLEKYGDGLPSDPTLRYDLIQRGFSPISAEAALLAFKRSVQYSDYYSVPEGGENGSALADLVDDDSVQAAKLEQGLAHANDPAPPVSTPPQRLRHVSGLIGSTSEEDGDHIPVRLSGGRRAWLIIPSHFYRADKQRLKAQIDLLLTEDEDEEEDI